MNEESKKKWEDNNLAWNNRRKKENENIEFNEIKEVKPENIIKEKNKDF